MTLKQAEERLTKIESLVESLLLRLGVVEKKLETVEILRKQVDDTENIQAIHELSVEDKMKDDKSKETIVLLGDSLTRGVGAKLAYQSNMVSAICRPGAHIDDITEEVHKLGDNEDRHVVLLVGTNDIQGEGSEVILSKYKNLIGESQKIKNRKVSVVGIPRRGDLDSFYNSRRLGVNNRLKEMCKGSNVEFLDYEPRDSWLARVGLHLNHLGQNELGFKIYQHCKSFLL